MYNLIILLISIILWFNRGTMDYVCPSNEGKKRDRYHELREWKGTWSCYTYFINHYLHGKNTSVHGLWSEYQICIFIGKK